MLFLPAGTTRNIILDIPFVSHLSRLRAQNSGNPFESVGMLTIRVFNVLRTGAAASAGALSCRVSVFASFPDSDFQVLLPQGELLEEKGAVTILPEGGVSSILKIPKTIDYKVSGGPKFARFNFEGNLGDAVGSILDRPNVGLNPQQVVRKAYPDISTLTNVDQMTVLDAYPDQKTEFVPSEFGTSVDEMELPYLWSKFTFLNRVGWSDLHPPGTILYRGPLSPCPFAQIVSAGDRYTPTLVEYATLPFRMWRGPLRLQIMFVASRVITGRVAICTHYGGPGLGADLNEAMSQYAHIIDLAADNMTHVVDFPWRSSREMLYVPTAGVVNDLFDHTMGTFTIRVVNTLKSMDSASSVVEMNLFWAAADGYRVAFLGSQNLFVDAGD